HSQNLLNLWMLARNVDFKTALRQAAEWLGETSNRSTDAGQSGSKTRSTSTLDWQACVEAFTEKHVQWLAKWRGYSIEFCRWLRENGLVGLFNGCIAFPVHDRAGNVIAIHYRLKDGAWRYHPQGARVYLLVIGELVPGDTVYVFE